MTHMDDSDRRHQPEGDVPFIVLGARKLKRSLKSSGSSTPQQRIQSNVRRIDTGFLQEITGTSVNKQEHPSHATTQTVDIEGGKRKSRRILVRFVVAFGVLALLTALSEPVADYLTIAHANPAMLKLAHESGMTRKGELLFLRTNPQFVSDEQMSQDCPSLAQSTNSTGFILQGCYIPNQSTPSTGSIYLRQMPSDLYNLEVVTAAYEMLHAAYYNIADSKAVDQNIESNYLGLDDPTASNLVDEFAKTEPGARDLELFSILGTQDYDSLDTTLQGYYKLYLSNPDTVVSDNTQVANMFQNDKNQLQQLQNTINTDTDNANIAYQDSVSWANVGNQYEDDYNYNIYSQDIDNANAAVDQYNTVLQAYNTLVAEYDGQQLSPMQSVQVQSN